MLCFLCFHFYDLNNASHTLRQWIPPFYASPRPRLRIRTVGPPFFLRKNCHQPRIFRLTDLVLWFDVTYRHLVTLTPAQIRKWPFSLALLLLSPVVWIWFESSDTKKIGTSVVSFRTIIATPSLRLNVSMYPNYDRSFHDALSLRINIAVMPSSNFATNATQRMPTLTCSCLYLHMN